MKRIYDFSTFINENFINEAEEIDGFGGIKILSGGGTIRDKIPYFTVMDTHVEFSKRDGSRRGQLEFIGDDQIDEQKGIFTSGGDMLKPDEKKETKILTTPAEAFAKAYEVLAELLFIYTKKQASDFTQQEVTDVVKSVLMILKNPTLNTVVAKNSLFKNFVRGLQTQMDVKKSLGEIANYEGVEPETFKNGVMDALKSK